MQDNQLFAAASFLIGDNQLSRAQRTPFIGKSAIFAPQELTPRNNGVLVEMGSLHSEGVLAAQWDFAALRDLWENSETPIRRHLPLQQAGQALAQLYARLQALPKVAQLDQLPGSEVPPEEIAKPKMISTQTLDDLVVIATVTQRWPPELDTVEEPLLSVSPAATSSAEGDDDIFDEVGADPGQMTRRFDRRGERRRSPRRAQWLCCRLCHHAWKQRHCGYVRRVWRGRRG
jgi:hypothetical protein